MCSVCCARDFEVMRRVKNMCVSLIMRKVVNDIWRLIRVMGAM